MRKFSLAGCIGCTLMTLMFLQCRTEQENRSFVQPPFRNVNVNTSSYVTDTDREQTLKLANGTRIRIPAHAFLNRDGRPVSGSVRIAYREFHTAADIILSGIPMSYDSAGIHMNFQSAGMFEINAFAAGSGEPLVLDPAKGISVNLASSRDGDYNFYYFDSTAGKWQYLNTNRPDANPSRQLMSKEIAAVEKQKPLMPRKLDEKAVRFDMEVNYNQFPELEGFNNVVWEYAGHEGSTNPAANEWIYRESWSSVKLEPDSLHPGTFGIQLRNSMKTFQTQVRPSFSSTDYAAAMKQFSEKMSAYDERVKAMALQQQQYAAEAELLRSCQISRLGIFNCDRQMRNGAIAFNARFQLDKDMKRLPGNISVFLVINGSDVIRYSLSGDGTSSFAVYPSEINQVVAVLPGNRIAVFGKEAFSSIDFAQLSYQSKPEYTFQLKTLHKQITAGDDLQELLGSI